MEGRRNAAPPDPWATVLAHGLVLFVVLLLARLGKTVFAVVEPAGFDRLALILPDLGFVLLFEGLWLILARGRSGRVWHGLLLAGHLVLYAYVLVNHGFFINAGYRVDYGLARYAVTHLGTIWEILEDSVSFGFWAQAVAVLVALLLAGRLAVLLARRPRRPPLALQAVLPVVGLALVVWSPGSDPDVRDLSRNDAAAFVVSAVRALVPQDRSVPGVVAPEALYQAPRLVSRRAERRPDIVLVLLESTGAQVTGVDFAASGLTPNLAALASDAVVFDSVYSTVTHTSKALIGILCGMVARSEMPAIESLPGGLPLTCLPELLAEAGYRTAFLQTARGAFENRPGLVENLGYQRGAYRETMLREPFDKTGYLGMDEFAMLEPAVSWAAEGEEPYFLTLLTVTPHHPYDVPGRGQEAPAVERYRWALQHQDAFVGALHSGLEAVGALDDALFIVLGDHGEAFGEHRIYEHDAVSYEEVVWTPLFFSGPDWLDAPRRVGGLRSHLDLLPAILDVLGLEWEGRLLGQSLFSTAGHDAVFVSCWDRGRCVAMRQEDRKVVHHFRRKPTEVFDLSRDPDERRDLAPTLGDEELERLESAMRAYTLSFDLFWARHPMPDGGVVEEAAEPPPG